MRSVAGRGRGREEREKGKGRKEMGMGGLRRRRVMVGRRWGGDVKGMIEIRNFEIKCLQVKSMCYFQPRLFL